MKHRSTIIITLFLCLFTMLGCAGSRKGNQGQMSTYRIAEKEAEWIRNGEPIKFEGELWFPQDGTETLMDSEMILIDDYRGVQFFIEKIDVRPYGRLYTKFGKNKFRFFNKQTPKP